MVFKKEIIYPIFLECCLYIENSTWRQIFEDLSYGICPYKCFINKGYLCCNVKNKNFIYKITSKKDPKEIYEDVKKLLDEKLDIFGNNNKELEIIEQNNNNASTNIINKWSKIKKKNTREFLIHNFLVSIKKTYNIKKQDILKLARLARLRLTDAEVEKYQKELSSILEYVEHLNTVDVSNITPTYQVSGLTNVAREDELIDYGVSNKELLSNVPQHDGLYIKVKRML